MKMKLGFFVTVLIVAAGCSTASVRVMPGENGIHTVSVRDVQKESAEEAAVDGAKDYCKKHNAEAVFVNDKGTKYTGSMNENTRNTVRKASTAAMILSPAVGVGSGSGVAGGVLGGAGMVGHTMTNDKDYQTELTFKCKKVVSD